MNRLITFIIAAVAIFLVEEQARRLFTNYRDPYVYHSARAIEPRVASGTLLKIELSFTHIRYCQEILSRFMIFGADGSIVSRDTVPGGATLLGPHTIIMPIMTPIGAKAGAYTLRMFANAECSDGIHVTPMPDIAFEIVE